MAKRPVQHMPDDVRAELEESDLLALYEERPFYQRNDYLSWIGRAKKMETRRRRIEQMLGELAEGGVYMGMDHPPSRKDEARCVGASGPHAGIRRGRQDHGSDRR